MKLMSNGHLLGPQVLWHSKRHPVDSIVHQTSYEGGGSILPRRDLNRRRPVPGFGQSLGGRTSSRGAAFDGYGKRIKAAF